MSCEELNQEKTSRSYLYSYDIFHYLYILDKRVITLVSRQLVKLKGVRPGNSI